MEYPIKNSTHRNIIYKLRALWEESGGIAHKIPEQWPVNVRCKIIEGYEIVFDCGTPCEMFTADGSYMILGDCTLGDRKLFWKLLNASFNTEVIEQAMHNPYKDSGPRIKITENKESFRW